MPNRLQHEQSPYLLQHAHNPVDWYPWGDEAFSLAREQHKPVIVSIGYAACHWCHVMERESFEDATVAAYMNEHFVCIKVDREEHPDVDHFFMDAVQAISGSGGWPLNVFVTPERIPFYGGTYFPPRAAQNRPSWGQLLQRMNSIWNNQQDEVSAQSEQMVQYLKNASEIAMKSDPGAWSAAAFDTMAENLLKMADKEWGGFGNAPKFPGTMAISFLLEYYHFTRNGAALAHALKSLDAMIDGGIYDQLGGGFARYSTDRQWLAPHFEKMLYDNALLVLCLCDAFQLTGKQQYREIIEETLAFAERELRDPQGGYYCALDADSEGVEGEFYTWSWDEWCSVLGVNNPLAASFFGVKQEGNWEGTNILHRARKTVEIAAETGLSPEEVSEQINAVKRELFAARKHRIRPHTDDKVMLSWNALMNLALSRAGSVLQRPEYLQRAEAHMGWLLKAMVVNGQLLHTWKAGTARIPAKLDDYAYLIQALLQLGSANGDSELFFTAEKLVNDVLLNFGREDTGFFYFTSRLQHDIPVKKVDVYDGATPSANAVMAHNLLLLGLVLERNDWMELSERMLRQMLGSSTRYTYSFGYWAVLQQRFIAGNKTAVFVGEEAKKRCQELKISFTPEIFSLFSLTGKKELPVQKGKRAINENLIFVCTMQACLPPYSSVEAVLQKYPGFTIDGKNSANV